MTSANPSVPVILIDGSSYLFRAFHAMPPLTNSKGQPTGAVKGVINMVRSMVLEYPDSIIAVVFDAKGPTFRHQQYAEYKANRPPMPDDLRVQIEPIHAIIKAMGLPLLCVEGVEADDVIGTLARQATEQGRECIISTGDKDMAQLVSEHVRLVNTMKNEVLDVQGVNDKYGFGPEHMIDYLALMGDKVDNIPGVPGVGEKTAQALIAGIGGLDDLYANLDKIAGLTFRGAKTMAKKLEDNKELAYLSHQLATIKCDVELDYAVDTLRHDTPDKDALLNLYLEQEFKTWVNELGGDMPAKPAANGRSAESVSSQQTEAVETELEFPQTTQAKCVATQEGLKQLIEQIWSARQLALVPVREKGHYLRTRLTGLAFCMTPGTAYYLPFSCQAEDTPVLLDDHLALELLKPVLESYDITKIAHDIKALRHAFKPYGIRLANCKQDTMLKAFVADSTIRRVSELSAHFGHLSIDNLVRRYLNWSPQTIEEVAGATGVKQKTIDSLPLNESTRYLAEQADAVMRMNIWLDARLAATGELEKVYTGIEQPLIPVLTRVEDAGAMLNVEYLHSLTEKFRQRMGVLEREAHEEAGEAFNLSSPKQIGVILFEKQGLPVLQKTATGQPSTNEEVLSELALTYDLPKRILEYRHLNKLVGTYTEPLPGLVNPDTGRVHTSYNQAGAATGRFSSNDPNLQNIPVRSEEGRAIRQAFIAPEGYKIVAADYSQIELRIMTHLSQDQNLIKAFREGRDIHRATAAEVMGVAEDQVSSEQRRNAKAINFGLIYGMSAFGLAKQLGIGRKEAQEYVDTYFARYPGVRRYMDETRAEASETGYVETIFGRRLYLPDIKASKQMLRKAAERTAINAPMQGTAADIIKRAMVDVQAWLGSSRLDATMIMQVHDELIFEVPERNVEEFIHGVKLRMQHAADIDVPLVVDVGVGENWEQAH
ncbi:DNA polymerase I [Gynuella sunshinyii]|uniref:DNA polymerase I n=1 Tax=Gynuella sunshinyii YC6258 TaxID=1445510 RepID=A0A0C5VIH2_9GAMM|nr:DNA polymerase I [Gynuella sunshinyii]AJQ93148.1 DNA polymerase I - 3'-5' exonuclease and polymerase domain [Gynuella sunshinyii YC6258]